MKKLTKAILSISLVYVLSINVSAAENDSINTDRKSSIKNQNVIENKKATKTYRAVTTGEQGSTKTTISSTEYKVTFKTNDGYTYISYYKIITKNNVA